MPGLRAGAREGSRVEPIGRRRGGGRASPGRSSGRARSFLPGHSRAPSESPAGGLPGSDAPGGSAEPACLRAPSPEGSARRTRRPIRAARSRPRSRQRQCLGQIVPGGLSQPWGRSPRSHSGHGMCSNDPRPSEVNLHPNWQNLPLVRHLRWSLRRHLRRHLHSGASRLSVSPHA